MSATRVLGLLGLLVALAAACSGDHETSLRLDVQYDSSWRLDAFELSIGDMLDRGSAARTVRVVVPDDWAGRSLELELDATRAGERFAHGSMQFTPVMGTEVHGTLVLSRLPCGAWCTEGATACEADGIVTCGQRDDDQCMEWSAPVTCGSGMPFCSLGVCGTSCVDECAAGETRCAGPDGVQTCGENDSDSCKDWLAPVGCTGGDTCTNGACTPLCQDECEPGQVTCLGSGTATCGDLDANGCLEWSPVQPCPGAQTCSAGACSATCTDECTVASCSGSAFTACGQFDLDTCLDRSPGTSCVPADPCREGACTTTGCTDVPKVCDQPPAAACLDATTLRTYSAAGTCSVGTCSYAPTDTPCASGCSAGVCTGGCGTCAPETFATLGVGALDAVALDATHVYWATSVGLFGRAKTGGATDNFTTGGVRDIAIDATHVYWTTNSDSVRRRAKAGGTVELVAGGTTEASGVRFLALDDTYVYWTTSVGRQVVRRPKAGGAVEVIASGQASPAGIAVDATHVYWTNWAAPSGTVQRRAKSGGIVETIATAPYVWAVAVDDTHVYWTTSTLLDETGIVSRRAKSGGAVEPIAAGLGSADSVVLDATHVYWTHSGGLDCRAKAGGAVMNLATLPSYGGDVAVDADHIYWTDHPSVMRKSRCACGL